MMRFFALPARAFCPEVTQQFGPNLEINSAARIPFTNDMRCGWIQTGNVVQPADAGIERQMSRLRVMPARMCGQATHRHGTRKAAMNEQRTGLFQQFNQAIQPRIAEVGQPG